MGKTYISSTRKSDNSVRLLEVSVAQASDIYKRIKREAPKASLGLYGAPDIATLHRTQAHLQGSSVFDSVEDFLHAIK